ncbi:hypothetical protein IWX90DRAFT_420914, partial [Phyllosticta citrichinensis]
MPPKQTQSLVEGNIWNLSRQHHRRAALRCFGTHGSETRQKFEDRNPHLTHAERQALYNSGTNLNQPISWPIGKPVFAPFKIIKDSGYTQRRYQNVKYGTHRVTFADYYGNQHGSDISHTLYCGKGGSNHDQPSTGTNINPLQLCAESNELNQSRKACFLAFEYRLYARISAVPDATGAPGIRHTFLNSSNPVCESLHGHMRCDFDWRSWRNEWDAYMGQGAGVSSSFFTGQSFIMQGDTDTEADTESD